MHQPNIPEQFAQQPQVQQLLLDMLVNPIADHSAAVLDALGGVTFCVAYSVSLLRASCKLDALIVPSMSGRKPEITKNKGVAYHTWLYHFLGGETEKLVPPPTCCSAASTAWSVRLRTEAARFEVEYKREVERLRRKGDTAQDDLKELRGAPVDPVLLRRVDRVARRGGGSDPPHPDGSNNTSEWQLQTARLVAFAMGTHPRLGLGYASRDQPCGVRRIAGQHDVLRNIAAHVRNLPPRTLAPPKPELVQLRALNVELYSKNLQLQELVTELSVRMDAAEAAEQRALRREDCAARRTEAALIEAQYAFQKGVQQGASEQAVKVKALKKVLRCERQEHKDTAVQVQLTEQRVYNEGTNRVRAAIAELRQQNVDAAVARDMAVADAVARGETAAQLQAALERVRCTSKAVLLQQVAEQREEIRKLGERRKAGQRTIAEANLDRRRMKLAQERAAAAEAHVAEYFITDEAQRQRAERADSLEKQVTDLQSEVKELTKMMAKYRAVAEPPKEKFYNKGAYTADVDLTALEVIASVGVAATAVPKLFIIFARFFGIKIPSRKVSVLARVVNGQRIYENKEVPYIPGNTHMKELPAIGGELHKIQAGEWLANDVTGRYCYINDGANSQQKDEIVHILSKRNKSTGRLESMVLSLDEITDKSSEGQYAKFKATLEAIAGAWEEAEGLGLLDSEHGDSSCMTESKDGAETPQDARSFFQNQRKRWRAELRGNIAHLTAAASMNDRASTARKTARLARGGDASGGDGDVSDDPTCAHHAVANIGEEGRKAIDTRLKTKMNITLEQSEADSAKIKALRTNVGWFSSPACSLIYQVCKYVALFSSKGYAIGENFAQWLAHKLKTTERLAGELIGHVEDLLAICGGRDYVFFLDAGVVDRFSQIESLYGFLLEETDLGAEAGGKLRKAIITGFESVYCMAAVKSMAIISDVWLWPMLRAIEPGDDVHILDVCPHLWPRTCAWLEEAAEDPLSAIDGSICLHSSFEAAQLRTVSRHEEGATAKRRSERAQLDLERIRAAIDGDVELRTEVLAMLSTAFMAMAAAVRNHASEFMPGSTRAYYHALSSNARPPTHTLRSPTWYIGGPFCLANITVQLRERLDGVPLTSVSAETMFARLKRRAERTGRARHDTQTGALLCDRDKTIAWARSKGDTKASGLWDVSRKRWRKGSGQRTIADERALKGAEKAPERTEKLSKKRRSRTKKLEELERLKQVTLASKYSELKSMRNDELSDQLKIYKVLEKKTGFITTGTRVELVLAVQLHMYEKFGESANDLEDGDSGVEGRGVRRRKVGSGAIEGKARKRKRGNIVQLRGWEWDSSEEFVIDRLIGKMVADGVTDVPGREGERIAANTVLYKVLWEGFPPEIATWEEEDNIPCGEKDFVSDYESSLEEELKLDKEDNGALSSDSDVDA